MSYVPRPTSSATVQGRGRARVTYLDSVLLLEPVVQLLEGGSRVRIVADLHELNAELARGDRVCLEAPRGVDDDGLWVVR